MQLYEVFIILKPNLGEGEVESFRQELEQKLASDEVVIDNSETKLSQQLSYPINKQTKGHFVRWEVSAPKSANLAAKINQYLAVNENILRQLVFIRPALKEQEKKPVSVIDQLRRQEQPSRSMSTPIANQKEEQKKLIEAPMSKSQSPDQSAEKEKADLEEIDKKIEELLK